MKRIHLTFAGFALAALATLAACNDSPTETRENVRSEFHGPPSLDGGVVGGGSGRNDSTRVGGSAAAPDTTSTSSTGPVAGGGGGASN